MCTELRFEEEVAGIDADAAHPPGRDGFLQRRLERRICAAFSIGGVDVVLHLGRFIQNDAHVRHQSITVAVIQYHAIIIHRFVPFFLFLFFSEDVLGKFGDDDLIEALDAVQRAFNRAAEFTGQVVELFGPNLGHLEILGQSEQLQADRVVNLGPRRRRRVAVALRVQIYGHRNNIIILKPRYVILNSTSNRFESSGINLSNIFNKVHVE